MKCLIFGKIDSWPTLKLGLCPQKDCKQTIFTVLNLMPFSNIVKNVREELWKPRDKGSETSRDTRDVRDAR